MAPLALVTGAAHRLGRSFALTLARLGYDIVLHYYSADDAALQTKAEIESLKRNVFLAQADLTDLAQINSLLVNIESLAVLVNSAAFMPSGNVNALSIGNWDTALDLNLRAPFLLAQAHVHQGIGKGVLLNKTVVLFLEPRAEVPSSSPHETALPFIHPFHLFIEDQGGGPVHAFQGVDRIRVRMPEFTSITSVVDHPLLSLMAGF